MKKEWPVKRLGEVCEIIMGQSPDGESYNTTGEGVPLINGPVEFSVESFGKTVRTKFTTQPTKFCKEGDLILCVRGSTTGRMNIAGFDACVGRGVAAIRAKQYQPWINHFISSKRDEIYGKGTGATFPNVSGDSLANFELVFPPLPEQQRIVALLDDAFAGLDIVKANAERNLQNARAIFDIHLESVFSERGDEWVDKAFEELIESNIIGLTKNSHEQGDDKAWPYVKMNNITRDNRFAFSRYTCVDATSEEVSKFALKEGDFLFNTRNSHELVGKSCIYESDSKDPVLYNNNIMRIRFQHGIDPKFILLAFSSKGIVKELNALKSGTTNVSAIYFKDLKSLLIPVPSFAEQKKIAAMLLGLSEETQHLTRLYEHKLAALEELKKSLLQQAFNGEL
jgi:type I restriction enzyme S subunit